MADSQKGDGVASGVEMRLTPHLQILDSPATPLPVHASKTSSLSRQERRDQRINELLESCRTQTLAQIIGPFGLTPAMFQDKLGGNVTTQHNAEQGIFAKETEEYNRKDYSYSKAKTEKKKEYGIPLGKGADISSGSFVDAYTGKVEPLQQHDKGGNPIFDKNGNPQKNYSLDHAIPLHKLHGKGGWMKDRPGRNKISSEKDNLYYTTNRANSKKSDHDPKEALSRDNGYDQRRIAPKLKKAEDSTNKLLPTDWERLKYHGNELAIEGSKDAGRNALRQAMGLLLHEFVNSSYLEVKAIVLEPVPTENLVDRVVVALERTVRRVTDKMQDAFDALISGGLQGAVSNLLTFLINNLITTSAKIVKIIRESMASLWRAMKFLWSPPEHMSGMDVAREVTKLITGVITTSLGLLFDETIKGFVLAVPLLAPIAGIVAPAITGLLTGLMTALTVYAIDRLFDWLADPGTEMLNAQIGVLDAQTEVARKLGDFMEQQYTNSNRYQHVIIRYQAMARDLSITEEQLQAATTTAHAAIDVRSNTISMMRKGFESWEPNGSELSRLISDYKFEE